MTLAVSDPIRDLDEPLSQAARSLGLALERQQAERLLAYLSLLQRWNTVHNLSGAQDGAILLRQHVLDCLAAVPPLTRFAEGRACRVLDAGTGAGLPAVVLAIMRPEFAVTAVDSVAKKIAFLRQVCGEIDLPNLQPVHKRLEELARAAPRFGVITSRAFSSLRRLVELTGSLIEPSGIWAAMKAQPSDAELHDLPENCQLFHVERLTVPGLNAHRCLVWMRPVVAVRPSTIG